MENRKITDNLIYDDRTMRLRKSQNNLAIAGMGVVLFGAWSIVKNMINLVRIQDEIGQVIMGMDMNLTAEQIDVVRIVIDVLYSLVIIIGVVLRFHVGLSAEREARGRRKSRFYVVLAVFLLIFTCINLVTTFLWGDTEMDLLSEGAAILVDTISILTTFLLIVSACRVRKLTEQKGKPYAG